MGDGAMKTVVFDLDGTLADTSADLIAAANACFVDMGAGAQLDPVADAATAFAGGRAMLRLGFSRMEHGDIDAMVERYFPFLLKAYEADIDVHTVLYPGVMEAIEVLKTRGYAVGICTNKPEGLAEELMRRLGVRDAFGALVGADTLPTRKPDPAPLYETIRRLGGDPARSVLIGDTITDRKTSEAADGLSVLVTFGPDGMAVADLNPDGLLHDYKDLPDLVDALWQQRWGDAA